MIARLQQVSGTASRLVAYLAVSMIVLAAALTLVDVFFRSVLRSPIFGTNDVVVLALILGVTGCFPYALAIRQHMSVDVVGRRLGPRGYWSLELFASLATLAVFAGFAIEFARRAERLGMTNEGTQLLLIPLGPFWWLAAGLLAVAAAVQAVVVLENVQALASRRLPTAPGEAGGS